MPNIRITKKFRFEAAHALYGYDGKCKNIHGHNYNLFVTVIGVPISATDLRGVDSLYSIVQMPRGYPVATMAIGAPGAFNAAIFAIQILAVSDIAVKQKIKDWRLDTTNRVKDEPE